MRFFIVIVAILAVTAGGAWFAKKAESGDVPTVTSLRAVGGNDAVAGSPADKADDQARKEARRPEIALEREQERLEAQQDILERRDQIVREREAAPIEREQERIEQTQKLMKERQELERAQMALPYEQEIERLEAQKELLRHQQELREMQAEMHQVPSPVTEGIRPYPLGRQR